MIPLNLTGWNVVEPCFGVLMVYFVRNMLISSDLYSV